MPRKDRPWPVRTLLTVPFGYFQGVVGECQMGSVLMGSLQMSCFIDRGTFWVLPLTYFIFPKVPGRTFSPNRSKFITFAAAPLVLTPVVCSQGHRDACPGGVLCEEPCRRDAMRRAMPNGLLSRSHSPDLEQVPLQGGQDI